MMDRIMNEIWRALNVSSSQVSSEGITLSRAVTTSNLFEHLCYLSSNESPESNSVTRLKTCRMWRERTLDQVELALLDMELCLLADIFVGNYFSSFSRTIIERRALLGKDSVSF
ncbi:hypothetical protein M427DRAFT_447137 [Gonapodya prolifera JEL478]|uniref:Uncharacterized protein n=1 Tax=Gonapodya prolifera (strain JEL478) TaxID=1344416 RepID=A0A139A390_GONPJ|nr:hypothetical protein M427DRAFT_447137 [Gonapodya prolifera JEL478]|eukprot:KXS11098.1 hypothetical protein M427DRAFT_447137 [Gonapodya prolifera JEL478]